MGCWDVDFRLAAVPVRRPAAWISRDTCGTKMAKGRERQHVLSHSGKTRRMPVLAGLVPQIVRLICGKTFRKCTMRRAHLQKKICKDQASNGSAPPYRVCASLEKDSCEMHTSVSLSLMHK